MAKRKYSIQFSGVSKNANDIRHDGKMTVSYCYMFGNSDIRDKYEKDGGYPLSVGKVGYDNFIPASSAGYQAKDPFMLNYVTNGILGLNEAQGAYSNDSLSGSHSIYRREYDIYQKPGSKIKGYYYEGEFYYQQTHSRDSADKIVPHPGFIYIDINTNYAYQYNSSLKRYVLTALYKEYCGEWTPVAINYDMNSFRDFAVTNGRSYQYLICSSDGSGRQIFANATQDVFVPDSKYVGQGRIIPGGAETASMRGGPVKTHWNEWSLIELEPFYDGTEVLVSKPRYKAKLDQLWLFRFSLETGALTQNISRSDVQTLGRFPKMGYGKADYASGEVSALLGSEIIPYSRHTPYIERLKEARVAPLSTNEKTEMLKQWRRLVSSKNPKLLKDIKGQSWIVQITGSSNRAQNFYPNQPDTITFQWKQVADASDCIIVGDGGNLSFEEQEGDEQWSSIF